MGIVGGDEVGARPSGVVEVRELGALEAFLAEDGEPSLDEGEPGGVGRQPVEDESAPGPVGQPDGDLGRAVQADRVEDEMDRLAERRLSVEQIQQLAELARAMPPTDDRGDLAVADRERRQQVGGAVAYVLELAAGRAAGCGRLTRGGRAAHADPGLLVDAEGGAVIDRKSTRLNSSHAK